MCFHGDTVRRHTPTAEKTVAAPSDRKTTRRKPVVKAKARTRIARRGALASA